VDRRIFSDQTIRGQDNLASLEAIQDRPWCGWGLYTYPEDYSFREDAATDIHPLLRVGLAGGWIGVFLAIRLQGLLVWRFGRACRRQATAAMPRVAPYLAILATSLLVINVIGAGGTLMGQALIAMSIFIGLLAAEYARPDPSDAPAKANPSTRQGASSGATPP
jgi:O-antigen ligase